MKERCIFSNYLAGHILYSGKGVFNRLSAWFYNFRVPFGFLQYLIWVLETPLCLCEASRLIPNALTLLPPAWVARPVAAVALGEMDWVVYSTQPLYPSRPCPPFPCLLVVRRRQKKKKRQMSFY